MVNCLKDFCISEGGMKETVVGRTTSNRNQEQFIGT